MFGALLLFCVVARRDIDDLVDHEIVVGDYGGLAYSFGEFVEIFHVEIEVQRVRLLANPLLMDLLEFGTQFSHFCMV